MVRRHTGFVPTLKYENAGSNRIEDINFRLTIKKETAARIIILAAVFLAIGMCYFLFLNRTKLPSTTRESVAGSGIVLVTMAT
jgi:hypothetical protein